MKQIISFLQALQQNNNRPWFNEHKGEYLAAKARFDDFAAQLIEAVRGFDPEIGPLAVKDCTWRIYRDTRFSHDKTPYKTHMGCFIAPGGRRSGMSGYYFQVGPTDDGTYKNGCIMATGNYYCESRTLAVLRDDIILDRGEAMFSAIEEAPDFRLDMDDALKKVPKGMPADEPFSHLLRLRKFCLATSVGHDLLLTDDPVTTIARRFATTKPFLDLVNRAIRYSAEDEEEGDYYVRI